MLALPPANVMALLRYWKFGLIAALVLTVAIQHVLLNRAHDALDREKAARVADRIEAERQAKEQKATTERTIIQYRDRIVQGGKVAERIEKAPLPGNCETPREILGADL